MKRNRILKFFGTVLAGLALGTDIADPEPMRLILGALALAVAFAQEVSDED